MKASHLREEQRELVRCLDCGVVYRLPIGQEEALPCPNCGAVSWVSLDPPRGLHTEKKS